VKRITAHEVALAGVATAIATIFLAVGNFTSILLFIGYLVASFALYLPLAKGSYRGYAMAYVSTVLLTLLLIGTAGYIVDLLPFIVFFGLHPLLNELELRFSVPKLKNTTGFSNFTAHRKWISKLNLPKFWIVPNALPLWSQIPFIQ
jgi:hypothetical protein